MRKFLPRHFRIWARKRFDNCFSRSDLGIERIGNDSGWWVITSRLTADAKVLSGGAGNDISFEIELARNRGCRVAIFDPSPTAARTFDLVGRNDPRLMCFPIGLDALNNRVSFGGPRHQEEGSFRLPGNGVQGVVQFECVSPQEALVRAGFQKIELVKIDIEGFEYGFLDAMLDANILPPQLAVEFHHFLPQIPFTRTLRLIRRLYRAGYFIAHKEQCDYLFVHRTAHAG